MARKKIEFDVIDRCPVPRGLADEVRFLKQKTGATLNSCDRSPEAEPILRQNGKKSQRELFELAQKGLGNPANPPGFSTHERRNDGTAYPGRRGSRLEDWQVGMDWSPPGPVVREAAKRGWIVTVTYPTNAQEAHHLNFRKAPELDVELKKGDTGKRVQEFTQKLANLRSPKTGEPYLEHDHFRYDRFVVAAVRRFQADYEQKRDGKLGSQTATQLEVAIREQREREKRDYKRGDRGPEVVRLSTALTVIVDPEGKPYLKRPHPRYDKFVEAAVKRFQADRKLKDDGIFGRKTRGTLYRVLARQAAATEKEKAAAAKAAKKPKKTKPSK
jgi:peptidoglycan hydrolase-like protein with peptidoglycan-binding domain